MESVFYPGQQVVLLAQPDLGLPEERAIIEGPSGPTTYIVRVAPVDEADDGLREVHTWYIDVVH